jgi:hypothetical protein
MTAAQVHACARLKQALDLIETYAPLETSNALPGPPGGAWRPYPH